MPSEKFVAGQRWASETEPEIGLGIVLKQGPGRVEIFFPAATEHRTYSLEGAPLVRVTLQPGDTFVSHEGEKFTVRTITEENGVLTYSGDEKSAPESALGDAINLNKPEDRLLAGQIDSHDAFALRQNALTQRHWLRQLRVRGFLGARIDLLPHQIFIASEVAGRILPRVLLADEVGLGKTIEAGLILHRLHLTGRAERILVIVPESLVHQWYVELLRRFNLGFSIYDADRCEAIAAQDGAPNPFLEGQLVLCALSLLAENQTLAGQAAEAGWDIVVVDEAHHIGWQEDAPSREYTTVERLAPPEAGLLLLTGTPAQSGFTGHFARLRLLDPARFTDLESFAGETAQFVELATVAGKLLAGETLDARDRGLFQKKPDRIRALLAEYEASVAGAGPRLAKKLADEFGPGRVLLRNTRAAIGGIRQRIPHLEPLPPGGSPLSRKAEWLAGLCRRISDEKILVLCATREEAEATAKAVQSKLAVKTALFHEGMSLVQRDRNAAWFAETDGARLLVCSGIGSEGRNFQFAQHLALLDIPADPEVVEQRVGRLDRIGQTSTIHVHVPYLAGGRTEVLARWLHEALNCFAEHVHGAAEVALAMAGDLDELAENFDAGKLGRLIQRGKELLQDVETELHAGHDRLLALNSCRPDEVAPVLGEIRSLDESTDLETFLLELLDPLGVDIELMSERTWLLKPGNLMVEGLPSLPQEGLTATFDRNRALARDDIAFMSWDHPLVRGALDAVLGSTLGNATCVLRRGAGDRGLLLEVVHVLETIAPPALHTDRFLPPTPITVSVDHKGEVQAEIQGGRDEPGNLNRLLSMPDFRNQVFPKMLRLAARAANNTAKKQIESASTMARLVLDDEIGRLRDLREINHHVTEEEISALTGQRDAILEAIAAARLRTDCLRLVQLTAED